MNNTHLLEAKDTISKHIKKKPSIAVILGSGLGILLIY